MSVERAPEAGHHPACRRKVTGASIENLSEREASERRARHAGPLH